MGDQARGPLWLVSTVCQKTMMELCLTEVVLFVSADEKLNNSELAAQIQHFLITGFKA